MKRFEGYYIFSDVDGTLMTSEFVVPPQNLQALQRFVQEGGRFALATGRGLYPTTRALVKTLPVNAPCLLLNGGIIHDFATEQTLFATELPDEIRALVQQILKAYPALHMAVWQYCDRYDIGAATTWLGDYKPIPPEQIKGSWSKVVIETQADFQPMLRDFIEQRLPQGVCITFSSANYTELMPQGIHKGSGVQRMAEQLDIPRERLLTVGDYYNDWEMLSLSTARCFCPANAPADIQAQCERVLCHVNDGALADLIAYIEQQG